MSYATILGVWPGEKVVELAELRNSRGWAPSVWRRLHSHDAQPVPGYCAYDECPELLRLWRGCDELPLWQQVPLVLTFDTGVIPRDRYAEAADLVDEFDRRLPAPDGHVNHAPAVAALLRTKPRVPYIGIWGTSVTDNPFAPLVDDDGGREVVPLRGMYVLRDRWAAPAPSVPHGETT